MNLRHRLIKWLAFGDLVILNLEDRGDGWLRSKELGGALIDNFRKETFGEKNVGVDLSWNNFPPRQTNSIAGFLFNRSTEGMINNSYFITHKDAQP